jgi:hypothetical protein
MDFSSTSAKERPTLLNIPQEVRENIYKYLSRSFAFRWDIRCNKVHVFVHNVPLVNVLCAHPRLHEEYLSSPCFQGLRITIKLKLKQFRPQIMEPPEGEAGVLAARFAATFFARTRHVTIALETRNVNLWFRREKETWKMVKKMTRKVIPLAPKLQTLKIAMLHCKYESQRGVPIPVQYRGPSYNANYFLSAPPPIFEGMALQQTALGWYPFVFSKDPHLRQIMTGCDAEDLPKDLDFVTRFVRCGAYVYGKGQKDGDLWDKDLFIETIRMESVPERVLGYSVDCLGSLAWCEIAAQQEDGGEGWTEPSDVIVLRGEPIPYRFVDSSSASDRSET